MGEARLLARMRKVGDYAGGIFHLIDEFDQLTRADVQSKMMEEVGALVAGIRAI
jgi:hypothetical protein